MAGGDGGDGGDDVPRPWRDDREKFFSDLLARSRSDAMSALPPIDPAQRGLFLSSCGAVASARSARDAAKAALDAAKRTGDAAASDAAKAALDAAEASLSNAVDVSVGAAGPVLDGLRDGLLESDALDPVLTRGAVLFNGTPAGLAEFCSGGREEDGLVMSLLGDSGLMRRMLEGGGAKGGQYGPAMRIYRGIRPGSDSLDGVYDYDDGDVLDRLALGTSLELAVPVAEFGSGGADFVDPVSRYRHYEAAHRCGELDPAFADRTAWELRLVVGSDAPDDQLAWGREMLRNYRPDLVRLGDTKWRYCNVVHTDVVYRRPPFQERTYQDVISGGGQCGPRAWFGRFMCRCFGIPTWGVRQPGHAAMTHWTVDQGWVVCLIYGGWWEIAWWEDRCGNDFLLETQARECRNDYISVLRLQWVADVIGEKELDHMTGIVDPDSFWRSLALCQKHILANRNAKSTALTCQDIVDTDEVPTADLASTGEITWATKERQQVVFGDNDTIVIPATSCSKPEKSTANVLFMDSFAGGTQLHHREDATVEYTLKNVPSAGSYTVSFRLVNVHSEEQPLLLTVSSDDDAAMATVVSIVVPYTIGTWAQTNPVEVELAEGTNVIAFTRETPNFGLSIKDITLSRVPS